MRTRYGISPWIDNFPRSRRPDHPRLRGELTADVVDYRRRADRLRDRLRMRRRRTQADPDRSGSHRAGKCGPRRGAAAAGAGAVIPGCHRAPWASHVAAHLRKLAARVARRGRAHPAAEIQCGLEACDHIAVASRDDGKALRREYEAREAAGLDAQWVLPANVRKATALEAPGGIRLGASLHARSLSRLPGPGRRGEVARRDLLRAIARHKGSCGRQAGGDRARRRPRPGSKPSSCAPVPPRASSSRCGVTSNRREQYFAMTEPVPAAIRKQLAGRECDDQRHGVAAASGSMDARRSAARHGRRAGRDAGAET